MKGQIHAGSPDCQRYQKIYHALRTGVKTTIQLVNLCHDCAPHSTIAEMRRAGYPIAPAEYRGRTEEGRKVYAYELVI